MDAYVAEFVGTTILVVLGNGVVANVVLKETKGHNAGWIVICAGWGLAVYTAALCVDDYSGAHLNPAVTVGLAAAGEFDAQMVPGYIAAQMAGAILGAAIVYLVHIHHYNVTDDPQAKLATFCTSPAIRSFPVNLVCEVVGTFVLVYAILQMQDPEFVLTGDTAVPVGMGSIGPLRVGLVVFGIGLCLGGPTGYAINPARDLGPRIAHAVLPIRGKGGSDWPYAPIPVLGPIAGGLLAAALSQV